MRKLLSDWNAPYIQALKRQIEGQSKTTLANWGKRQSQHTYSWNQQSEKIILNNKEHGSEQDDTSSETSRVGTTTVRL